MSSGILHTACWDDHHTDVTTGPVLLAQIVHTRCTALHYTARQCNVPFTWGGCRKKPPLSAGVKGIMPLTWANMCQHGRSIKRNAPLLASATALERSVSLKCIHCQKKSKWSLILFALCLSAVSEKNEMELHSPSCLRPSWNTVSARTALRAKKN